MKSHKEKIAANRENAYFWNRISGEMLDRCVFILLALLIILPLLIAVTGRHWISFSGVSVKEISDAKMVVGNYWFLLIEGIGMLTGLTLMMKLLQMKDRRIQLRNREWVRGHLLLLSMAAVLIWSILSTFFAKNKSDAIWGDDYYHAGLMLLLYGILFFAAGACLPENRVKAAGELLAGVGAVSGVLVLLAETGVSDFLYIESKTKVMFHNQNHYGIFLAICVSMAIGLTLQERKTGVLPKIGRALELWLIFNAMAVCETRGSFLAVILILICWNVYIWILQKDRRRTILAIDLLLLATYFFLNTGNGLRGRFLKIILEFLDLYHGQNKMKILDRMGSNRGELWRYGIQFALEKPIFGYGLSNLMEPYFAVVDTGYYSPHNCLILLAASLGFPAMIFYLSGLIAHLKGFFRFFKKMSILEVTTYAVVGTYLITSFFESWVYYTSPYYFLVLGLSYGVYRRHYEASLHPSEE